MVNYMAPADNDEVEKEVVVAETDTPTQHRGGHWYAFTDVYGNNYAYALEGASEKDKSKLIIAYWQVAENKAGGYWCKFFSLPINMYHFETEEEIAAVFETLFNTPRYKFFARPKHLHYKGYQPVPVHEPEEPDPTTFNVFDHDDEDHDDDLGDIGVGDEDNNDLWGVQERLNEASLFRQQAAANVTPTLWQRIRGNA